MSRGVTWHVNIVSTILELLGCKWDAERGRIGHRVPTSLWSQSRIKYHKWEKLTPLKRCQLVGCILKKGCQK